MRIHFAFDKMHRLQLDIEFCFNGTCKPSKFSLHTKINLGSQKLNIEISLRAYRFRYYRSGAQTYRVVDVNHNQWDLACASGPIQCTPHPQRGRQQYLHYGLLDLQVPLDLH